MGMAYVRPEGDLREALAALQHEIWSHWTRYMLSCCTSVGDQDNPLHVIPDEKVAWWLRQMQTSYAMLSDQERDRDREQADKVLALLDRPEFLPALQVLALTLQKRTEPFYLLQDELNRLRTERGVANVVNETRKHWYVAEVGADFPHGSFRAFLLDDPLKCTFPFEGCHVSEHDYEFVRVGAEFWSVWSHETDRAGSRCFSERLIFVPPTRT